MRHHRRVPDDEWQYGERSSSEVRETLLRLVLDFVQSARNVAGVVRIAMLGSLLSSKARPKDADLLVSLLGDIDLGPLAQLGRRLQGRAQGMNSTADIFLADEAGQYIGRVCRYRECFPRVRCQARHCGARPHLKDDLDALTLPRDLVASPPLTLHPMVTALITVPEDVQRLLLDPLATASQGGARLPAL